MMVEVRSARGGLMSFPDEEGWRVSLEGGRLANVEKEGRGLSLPLFVRRAGRVRKATYRRRSLEEEIVTYPTRG